ncbi:MAG: hypothetical protein PF572_05000 [Patescibacteria group bacterium]|jgi:hypothetical protein|nr:hypothetical protein [Patescibacteria group bacterium]
MTKKYFVAFFVLSFLFSFFLGQKVFAQSEDGIKISPVRIEDLVDPGQVISKFVTVTNESEAPREIFVFLRDFKAEGELGQAKLIEPGSESGSFLASWIEVATSGISFLPNESKDIPFFVRVPMEVGPGGYYGAVVFGTKPPEFKQDSENRGAGMSIGQQAATLILFQVKGDANEEITVREFSTDKEYYNTPFDIKFTSRLENKGNVHGAPVGTITIKNQIGKTVEEIIFNEKVSNILPKTFRRFEHNWIGDMAVGRYTATLGLTYGTPTGMGGQGMQTLYAERSFWILPWKIISAIVTAIIFLAIIIWLLLRMYKNKAIKKAMEVAGLAEVKYVKTYEGPSPTTHLVLIVSVVVISVILLIGIVYLIVFA